ncbi:isochorismatase hydrolase [Histoplasma capsulatum var. duboisii H88]|uniref:Isochorismatase hydrolase n=2 Tax=Ajellomyces capsulatus TaxID=5037 RepID=F0UTF1_AJEC8|nr:isochorismatase hydrolase [Histoplasma capsulatum H143]EGC49178.1 isochorismatase hydrolase [Histoplasma capsulatum var. duboisii H88]QSS54770.1 isochorismatase hydrolase [Histoplasma capsulatum var. duboisii H88]
MVISHECYGPGKAARYFRTPVILATLFEADPNSPIAKKIPKTIPNAPLIQRPGQINLMNDKSFVKAVEATGKKTSYHVAPEHYYSDVHEKMSR